MNRADANKIQGCDYHPGFQQIAFVDTETGEFGERRLTHREEAEQFYGTLKERSVRARVGMEASGHARWLERLLSDLRLSCGSGTRDESIACCGAQRRPAATYHAAHGREHQD